jgi:hypothetical protein
MSQDSLPWCLNGSSNFDRQVGWKQCGRAGFPGPRGLLAHEAQAEAQQVVHMIGKQQAALGAVGK